MDSLIHRVINREWPLWVQYFTFFSHFALALNASVNIFLYCSCDKRFFVVVVKMVKGWLPCCCCCAGFRCCGRTGSKPERGEFGRDSSARRRGGGGCGCGGQQAGALPGEENVSLVENTANELAGGDCSAYGDAEAAGKPEETQIDELLSSPNPRTEDGDLTSDVGLHNGSILPAAANGVRKSCLKRDETNNNRGRGRKRGSKSGFRHQLRRSFTLRKWRQNGELPKALRSSSSKEDASTAKKNSQTDLCDLNNTWV